MGMHHGILAASASQAELLAELARHTGKFVVGAPVVSPYDAEPAAMDRGWRMAIGERDGQAFLLDSSMVISNSADMLVAMSVRLGTVVGCGAETVSGSYWLTAARDGGLLRFVSLLANGGNSKATQSAGRGAGGGRDVPATTQAAPQRSAQAVVATAGRSWPARWLAGRLQARPPSREGGQGAGEQGAPEARRGPTGSDHHGRAARRRPSRSGAGRGDQASPGQRRRRRQAGVEAGHRDGDRNG